MIKLQRNFIQLGQNNSNFKVFQWNCLSQQLTDSKSFPNVDENCLKQEIRIPMIIQQIKEFSPDIICMQEVDQFEIIKDILNQEGYEVNWQKKSKTNDGLLLAFKQNNFDLQFYHSSPYKDESDQSDMSQLFIYCELMHKQSKKLIAIATTHLKAKEPFEDVRIVQVKQLLEFINTRALNSVYPVIISGDFNTEPHQSSVQQIFNQNFQNVTNNFPFTTFKVREKKYCRVIDYIFYQKCELLNYWDIPTEDQIGHQGLPSMQFPSDHYNIIATFGL